MSQLAIDGIIVQGDYLLKANNTILIASYFDRAKVKVKAIASMMGRKTLSYKGKNYGTKENSYRTIFKPVIMGRDHFVYTTSVNKEVGSRYLITTEDFLCRDVYDFLMVNYKLPLLKEWIPEIVKTFVNKGFANKIPAYATYVSDRNTVCIPVHEKSVPISEVLVYDFGDLDEQNLEDTVSQLLQNGRIHIADRPSKPLEFTDFAEYMSKYGGLAAAKLEEQIKPLVPLKGTVDTFAGLNKRMYPQQAAVVNGLIALMESGARYGLNVAEMGCGKTEMGMAFVDAAFNKKWLLRHPDKTLKDVYLEDAVNYRAIMMAPGHLIKKWKSEICSEIPGAQVEILDSFKKLIAIREEGKKPKGRRWYLISKDFCKLGSSYSPTPSVVGTSYVVKNYCLDCLESREEYVYQVGTGKKAHCPKCGGKHFAPEKLTGQGRYRGLMCPRCNNLLLSGKKDDLEGDVLRPSDFSSRKESNSFCAVCGEPLWGVVAPPVSNVYGTKEHESKWHKITHYKNYAHKEKTSAFVLKGHEQEYMDAVGLSSEPYTECKGAKGSRKYAPSLYIKKYLKGYFDICVLDEAHKYENGGTAQSNAASALYSTSKFTLGLTGTLSNGNAASFFYLLYMLDPERMRSMGFEYQDLMKFAYAFGCVETVYESSSSRQEQTYNSSSRGKVLQTPRIKPGISPVLFTKFLLDRCVMLALEDMSKYLPPLIEKVIPCQMPDDVESCYQQVITTLQGWTRNKEGGRTALSNMLQFGLSYPDKPYGRMPIKSGNFKDLILCVPENCSVYQDKILPKEEALIEIVKKEQAEGRNCFIYCSFTGKEESNVMDRLQSILVKTGIPSKEICIIRSETPAAIKRESYIHDKAAEGVRIFICNCKLVETGLDFCFTYNGKAYNYPTIIFYQISYELAVMWQASRRAYRLSQTEECRNYYLAYERTAQMAALKLMAEKQVAASAIQGKFSVDGLAAMAKGTDPRIVLAQKLADNDYESGEGLSKMFDALHNRAQKDTDGLDNVDLGITFRELMGADYVPSKVCGEEQRENISEDEMMDLLALTDRLAGDLRNDGVIEQSFETAEKTPEVVLTVVHDAELAKREAQVPKKKKRRRQKLEDQADLFELFETCV